MSGPKIIRIVTREEQLAIFEKHLARLDQTIAEWVKVGARDSTLDEVAVNATKGRREVIRALAEQGRFADAQRNAISENAFLRSDIDARIRNAIDAEVKSRQQKRNISSAASTLLNRITSSQREVPETLRHNLEMVISGDESSAFALKVISEAFSCLGFSEESTKPTQKQLEIAGKLIDRNAEKITISDWLASQRKTEDDVSFRIDALLSELEICAGHEIAKGFHVRTLVIAKEQSSTKRSLLCDSLVLDLVSAVKEQRLIATTKNDLSELRLQIIKFGTAESESLRAEIDAALETINPSEAKLVIARVERFISERVKLTAGIARRNAVLINMQKLGYEVREGMAGGWVNDGKVVVRKASNSSHGIEFSNASEEGRMQARVVRVKNSSASADSAQDRHEEEVWCNEYKRLQELIARTGGSVVLERALSPGEAPVKVVDLRSENAAGNHSSDKQKRSI